MTSQIKWGFSPLTLTSYKEKYSSLFLITDRNVAQLELVTGLQGFILEPGETSKTVEMATNIWNKMGEEKCDRKSCIIALGGGVVTDLAGFTASSFMRGIDYISIPTTLMGMVDAAIGGKTAVNLASGKNLIGSFYPPKEILIDPTLLKTLPDREFRSGLVEVIKIAFLFDASFFAFLEKEIATIRSDDKKLLSMIRRAIELKQQVVLQDEKERGIRACLNFGHTIGHAIEAATKYKKYLHGEAVSLGMKEELQLSIQQGLPKEDAERLLYLLSQNSALPEDSFALSTLLPYIMHDKKASQGKITFTIVKKMGEASLMQIPISEIWQNR